MAEHSDQHIQPYTHLLAVLAVLLALTATTVAASRMELGGLNIWMAILIASVKSTFVLLFFMHLKYEGRFIRRTFVATVFTLAVLVSFLFWDVSFR
ncbi:MAG: cytochrome C oxidase subunit IV family protein [Deltaproteobacteria bacterium]|nr:cytochrome C oxidase subunit IV family protein [Deltaproteobacteria bacterium]